MSTETKGPMGIFEWEISCVCSGGGSTSEAEDTHSLILKVAYIWARYGKISVLGAAR